MNPLHIEIESNAKAFEPGRKIRGRVCWELPQTPDVLELNLLWKTEGKGTTDLSIVEARKIAAARASGESDFEMELPAGPWSFSGRLISLKWVLELVEPGADLHEQIELVMAPGGREINLVNGIEAAE